MEVPVGGFPPLVAFCPLPSSIPKQPDEQSVSANAAVILARVRDVPLAARHAVRTCGFYQVIPFAVVAVTDRNVVITALLSGDGDRAGWGEQLEDESR
jgi:hypothetical protein